MGADTIQDVIVETLTTSSYLLIVFVADVAEWLQVICHIISLKIKKLLACCRGVCGKTIVFDLYWREFDITHINTNEKSR